MGCVKLVNLGFEFGSSRPSVESRLWSFRGFERAASVRSLLLLLPLPTQAGRCRQLSLLLLQQRRSNVTSNAAAAVDEKSRPVSLLLLLNSSVIIVSYLLLHPCLLGSRIRQQSSDFEH